MSNGTLMTRIRLVAIETMEIQEEHVQGEDQIDPRDVRGPASWASLAWAVSPLACLSEASEPR
jgi:hypothetical protein